MSLRHAAPMVAVRLMLALGAASLCGSAFAQAPAASQPSAKPKPADPHAKKPAEPAPKGKPGASAHPPGKPNPNDKHKKPAPPAAAPVPAPAVVPAPEKPPEAKKPEPPKGTGLPLPRFAALRSDEVNMRAGPGTRYPIDWVYKRRDLPVQIEREFEVWRLIRDPEGTKGWVHQATLTGRRTLIVTGETRALRKTAEPAAPEIAELKPGVIGRIRACEPGSEWCQVQVGEYRGYLRRSDFWGLLPGEAITN